MERFFINEKTGERKYAQRSAPWIDVYYPYTYGEIFPEGTGWRLRVWLSLSDDHATYLSEDLFPTEESAQKYLDYFRAIGRQLEIIMRSGG